MFFNQTVITYLSERFLCLLIKGFNATIFLIDAAKLGYTHRTMKTSTSVVCLPVTDETIWNYPSLFIVDF